MSIVPAHSCNPEHPGSQSAPTDFFDQPSTRLYKRYPSDMIAENGRRVSSPPSVCVRQSSDEELTAVAESNCLRVIRPGTSSTANKASGPRTDATLFLFSSSMASSRRGISNSISTRSPSFQPRCRARNFPGSIALSTRLPFTETLVFGPDHPGTRRYKVNVSGFARLSAICVVFVRGYSVFCVNVAWVLFCNHDRREGINRLT